MDGDGCLFVGCYVYDEVIDVGFDDVCVGVGVVCVF